MAARLDRFFRYIGECTRLLYWAYFKPFTLKAWLREIHPDLEIDTNPFIRLGSEFADNPRLRRYAEQGWWLSFVVPLLAILLVGQVYTLISGEAFNWLSSSLFVLGWEISLLPLRANNPKLRNGLYGFLILVTLFVFFGFSLAPNLFDTLAESLDISNFRGVVFGIVFGVLFSAVWSVVLSVVLSVVFGILFGAVFGAVWSVVLSVVSGVGWSVVLSVVSGVAWNVVLGVALSVIWSVVSGVALGVACIFGVLRVYFWIPELLWSIALFLLSRQSRADRYLPYLPPRFDELIYLPLPFLDILIADAYRQNPIAARQTLDYLLAFTNQQSLAADAIIKITIDCLDRCQNLGEMTVIDKQLVWLPSPLPEQLGSILPQFLEISQSVRSATLATSTYRQAELLAPPLTALERLQNELVFNRDGRLAGTFSRISQRWRKIIQKTRQDLEATTVYNREIPLAYIAGPALIPENAQYRFKGREDIFEQIETLALSAQPPVLLLYGGRRTGKTSALKYLPQRVGSELVPLLVDLQGAASATTLEAVAEYLAEEAIAAARKSRNLRLPEPDPRSLQRDPFPALQKWLKTIEAIAPQKRFLLCLDEFERLSEVVRETGSRAPLNFLRHVLQHRDRWILLFSGSHTLDELDDYWSDYLINTKSLRVTYLQRDRARELILRPIPDFPDIYEPEAVDRILELTRCQPYLVQLTGSVLVERLNQRLRQFPDETELPIATRQDVEAAIPKILEAGGLYFRELWKVTLSSPEREAVEYILLGKPPINSSTQILRKLVQKEVIEVGEDGIYRLQVPLVEIALRQFVANA